jgi:hypothetical protein
VPLLGPEAVDHAVTKLISIAQKDENLIILSLDFSAYDASISPQLIYSAFRYITKLFNSAFSNDLLEIYERFLTIEIISPDRVMKGEHGIPSGSTFTNEVGSIIQHIIINQIPGVISNICQGDDGLVLIPISEYSSITEQFKKYGLKLNESKTMKAQNECVFLQRYYSPDYRLQDDTIGGIYSCYRALSRIVFQERWSNFEEFGISGKDYYSIRTISILENCKYNPLFPELVKFVYELDKYSLDYNETGLIKYIDMLKKTDGSVGIIRNQYGVDLKGIKSFETVKLISSYSS